jgi:S1-C subfamily serine protease
VYPNTPADQAGLQPGDVIQKINGVDVKSAADVSSTVSKLKPGTQVALQVWSSGVRKMVSLTLGDKGQYQDQLQQQQGGIPQQQP